MGWMFLQDCNCVRQGGCRCLVEVPGSSHWQQTGHLSWMGFTLRVVDPSLALVTLVPGCGVEDTRTDMFRLICGLLSSICTFVKTIKVLLEIVQNFWTNKTTYQCFWWNLSSSVNTNPPAVNLLLHTYHSDLQPSHRWPGPNSYKEPLHLRDTTWACNFMDIVIYSCKP